MNKIKECMLGKDLILTLDAGTGGDGIVAVLCTEACEIKTSILLHYVNDEPIMINL